MKRLTRTIQRTAAFRDRPRIQEVGIQNFKRCSPNLVNYNDNFSRNIKFITSQLTLCSDLIWLKPASACSSMPHRARTTGAAELWRPCRRGEAIVPHPGHTPHTVHARALRPCLAVVPAWTLPLLPSVSAADEPLSPFVRLASLLARCRDR